MMASKEQLYNAIRVIINECAVRRINQECNKACPLNKWCMKSLPYSAPACDWEYPEND